MRKSSLGTCFEFWKKINAHSYILDWITRGVELPFSSIPRQFEHSNRSFTAAETAFINNEIETLLQTKCKTKFVNKPTCVSSISTVPKKNGRFRLIIDLWEVNNHLKPPKFVYEDIKQVIDIVKPKDKIITLDIKNGFYHIKVAPECSTYLGFTWRGRFYTWMVLPFGLNISPYYFCKTTRAVVHYLHQQGLRTVCYVDDFLLCDSDEHIGTSKKLLISTLEQLGFFINYKKSSIIPSSCQRYIGYVIETDQKENSI